MFLLLSFSLFRSSLDSGSYALLTLSFAHTSVVTCSVVNMKKAGILDPHKVTKNALLNASSIAGTILLTECTIVDNPEDEKESQPMMDPSMMM